MNDHVHLAHRALAAGLTLAAIAALARDARAQSPDPVPDPNVIWACFVPVSGTVYRIKTADTKESCSSPKHVMFSFNQTGPAGAQGPAGAAGTGATAFFKALTTRVGTPGPAVLSLNLPAGAYVLMARVRTETQTFDGEEGALNCSIGVPGQLASTETDVSRVLQQGSTSFVVVGAMTAVSPFTAFLNCAAGLVNSNPTTAVLAGTNFIAIKLESLVLQ